MNYAIVSHDHLHKHSNFQVIRAHQLFNETDLVGRCDPDHNISDHSVLKWQYELDNVTEQITVSEAAKTIIRKIDVSQIPDNFMGNVTLQRDINNTHIDITNSYSEFCNSIITEMEELLPVSRSQIVMACHYNLAVCVTTEWKILKFIFSPDIQVQVST